MNKVQFTCRSKSRIDLFLGSKNVKDKTAQIEIVSGPVKSDHLMLWLKLNIKPCERGPGYWKLNCSFLQENDYVKSVKNIIAQIAQEHYLPDQAKWEMCKIKIKEFSMYYGKQRQNKENTNLRALQEELNKIESQLSLKKDANLLSRKAEITDAIENHYLKEARAAQVRSRVKWIEDGEKGTKFFLGLEKQHQENNVITELKTHHGIIHKTEEILEEEVRFYTKLYTSTSVKDEDIDEYLDKVDLPHVLDENEKLKCEGLLSLSECQEVIKNMKMNRSPGNDGLPVEFYKTFWNDINILVVNSLNEAFCKGKLSSTQTRAIMSLIFKKGDRQLLKNWRPISLLNTDYKIAAFALANRLHRVLPRIVSEDQTGYVKNRYIGCNIRLIEDIIDYVNGS